jgi:hypothetical protein
MHCSSQNNFEKTPFFEWLINYGSSILRRLFGGVLVCMEHNQENDKKN